MNVVTLPLLLLVLHFVADFLFQNDWMAVNKSKRWDALALHVTIYSACFACYGWKFVALTWLSHFITDAITSRATSRLWFLPKVGEGMRPEWIQVEVKPYRHWFFVVVGFDQLIHAATLAATWSYLR